MGLLLGAWCLLALSSGFLLGLLLGLLAVAFCVLSALGLGPVALDSFCLALGRPFVAHFEVRVFYILALRSPKFCSQLAVARC